MNAAPQARAQESGGLHQMQAVYPFDVPRGDLSSVVVSIARSAGVPIAFPAGLVVGHMAGPIQGRHTVDAAMSEALAGTGFEVVPTPGGSFTIRQVKASTALRPLW